MPGCLPSIICQKKTALLSLICNTQQQMAARFSFSIPHSQNAKACFSTTGMLIFSPSLHQTFFFFFPCAIHLQTQQQAFLILGCHFLRYYFFLCRVQQQTFLALAFWFIWHLSIIYKMEQLWTLLPLGCQLIAPLAILSNKQQQMFLVTGLPVSLPSFPLKMQQQTSCDRGTRATSSNTWLSFTAQDPSLQPYGLHSSKASVQSRAMSLCD